MRVTYGAGFLPTVFDPGALLVRDRKGVMCFNVPDRTPAVIRARIKGFAQWLLSLPSDKLAEFEVEHTILDGTYTRKLYIPKDSILVGKIHLKACTNIVAKGDISVLTETGCGRFQAGHIAVSAPGIQKVGYAHEDTIFVNVFRTDKTSIEEIEAEIATEDEAVLERELICQ